MTNRQFYSIFSDAKTQKDRDAFVSEWATSSIFDPDAESPGPDYDSLARELGNIWDVAHMDVADIRATTGMTQGQFAERFCIPCRTVQNWERRKASCTHYTRLMMAELLGLLDVQREA